MDKEFFIVREKFHTAEHGKEGFTLGRIFDGTEFVGHTLEDEDLHLEEGKNAKTYGKSAMPLGRYSLVLYQSPKHGLVPRFLGVPGFDYTEIHGANHAEQLLGCVAVGENPTPDGVQSCAPVVQRIVQLIKDAQATGGRAHCTIKRFGD